MTPQAYLHRIALDIFEGTPWALQVDDDSNVAALLDTPGTLPITFRLDDGVFVVCVNGWDGDTGLRVSEFADPIDPSASARHEHTQKLITTLARMVNKHSYFTAWIGYLPPEVQAKILEARHGEDLGFFPKTRTYGPGGDLPPHVAVTLASPPGFVWHLHLSDHGHAYIGKNQGHTLTVTATPGPNTRWTVEWTAPGLPAQLVCRAESDEEDLQAVISKLRVEGAVAHNVRTPDLSGLG